MDRPYIHLNGFVQIQIQEMKARLTDYFWEGIDGKYRRPYETVLPLAWDLGLIVDTSCKRNDVSCVVHTVRSYDGPGNILIAWRHKRMRDILEMLGMTDPPKYPSDR